MYGVEMALNFPFLSSVECGPFLRQGWMPVLKILSQNEDHSRLNVKWYSGCHFFYLVSPFRQVNPLITQLTNNNSHVYNSPVAFDRKNT